MAAKSEHLLCAAQRRSWRQVRRTFVRWYIIGLLAALLFPAAFLWQFGLRDKWWALAFDQTTYMWYHIAAFPATLGFFVATICGPAFTWRKCAAILVASAFAIGW